MGKRNGWWGFMCLALAVTAQAAEQNGLALVTGDNVRVRAEPSLLAPQLGVLYKNLRVQVLEKSATTSMVDGKAYYWYRVRQDTIEGWCSEAFLNFKVPATAIDTYGAPAEMDWFYARYGSSTQFQDNTFNADSFTVEEYRRLMAATVQAGQNTSAPLVLKLSIYRHLKERPTDPAHQYLKARLYSQEFLLAMLNAGQFDVLPLLPHELALQAFTVWVKASNRSSDDLRTVLDQIPESASPLRGELAIIILDNASAGPAAGHDQEEDTGSTYGKKARKAKKAVRADVAPDMLPQLAINAPDVVENGAVVPFTVSINPPIGAGDVLILMAGMNHVCDVRPGGDVLLAGFSTRVRMSGSGNIRVIAARKNGARAESARRVNVTVAAAIPDEGSDSNAYKMRDKNEELLVLITNPMGHTGYVNNILFSLQSGSVNIETTPWLSANPFVSIRTPASLADAAVKISVKHE